MAQAVPVRFEMDAAAGGANRSSASALLKHEYRFARKSFWRTPFSAVIGTFLPLVFFILFNLFNLGENFQDTSVPFVQYSVAAVVVFVILATSYMSTAMSITVSRERGVLRRMQHMPVPQWAHFGGRILTMAVASFLSMAFMIIIGLLFFDLEIEAVNLPGVVLILLVGTVTFSMLGIALTSVIPTPEAAPVISIITVFPFLFASGLYFPVNIPAWLETVLWVFPVQPLASGLKDLFNPANAGFVMPWAELAIMGAWLVAGLMIAVRFFRWEPRHI